MVDSHLLQKAQDGDADAMMQVAEKYLEGDSMSDITTGIEWYEKTNSTIGYIQAATALSSIAKTFEDNQKDEYASAFWFRASQDALKSIPQPGDDMIYFDLSMELTEECFYNTALCRYLEGNPRGAMQLLENVGLNEEFYRERVLYSECMCACATGSMLTSDETSRFFDMAWPVFKFGNKYVLPDVVGAARHREQVVFAKVAVRIARIICEINEEQGKELLETALGALTDSEGKAMVSEAIYG